MEQLIYESKGGSKKRQQIIFICCIVVDACGILLCMLSQFKTSSYFGIKTYVLPLEMRIGLITFGIVCFIFATALFILTQRGNEMTYFRMFETHVESCTDIVLAKKVFNASFQEIEDVQISTVLGIYVITMRTKHMKYSYTLDQSEADKAFHLLKERVSTVV